MSKKSKDLINWHEVSRRLSGNGQNIRHNKIPKKYENSINRLKALVAVWENNRAFCCVCSKECDNPDIGFAMCDECKLPK